MTLTIRLRTALAIALAVVLGIMLAGLAGILYSAPASAHAEGRQWQSNTFSTTYHHVVRAKLSDSPAGSCDTHLVDRTVVWSIWPWTVGDKTTYTAKVC